MLVESKESVWPPVESKTKDEKENRRTAQAQEQARWNRENKLQWWNHSRNWLLRALLTWRRLKLLSDHRTLIIEFSISAGCKDGTETLKQFGELNFDCGGLRVQGTTECGYGVTFQGRKGDIHKTLISASRVHCKGHVAGVDSNGGVHHPLQQHTCEKDSTIRSKMRLSMNLVQYFCIFRMARLLDTPKFSNTCAQRIDQEKCSMFEPRTVWGGRGLRHSVGMSPMASVR